MDREVYHGMYSEIGDSESKLGMGLAWNNLLRVGKMLVRNLLRC